MLPCLTVKEVVAQDRHDGSIVPKEGKVEDAPIQDPAWKLQILGLLVWTLIAGTEYFRVPAFGWVMFVAVFYWVLTVFFLIVYITMTYTRIPQVPWTTVGLCFNGSAFILYLSAAIVDASSVAPERDSHNFNSWAASSFFAFLVTICYAGNTYFSFIAWRSRTVQ
ncbi:PREDICTED: CKLF-like MARVEL transmembrane domain-containing protein 8 [Myotis brandtii]|uniref:CKLF-like MARVEL transmembrane domain-containing protein 8 n=1 Tax=Myotis brandtii TaxID=109478 RepID=UPI000704512E|nr:PREDICTED: CKLF-like MARVEL transmembrane domain-containing protein 8 [Myotis brandtii]